ncbi:MULTISPECIES: YbaB/EbfC family nucleoid-associated protein [unclassified Micromonospora]|uniref:YbaB/EbfC family nucleoid-associated protein n=1 Tax=unclassified Micromonospora TaxID=2617518 RepID=UPI002FEE80F9
MLDPDGAVERLAEWKGRIDQLAADTRAMSERLQELRVTAADDNRLVEVTVDAAGRLFDLRLGQRIQRVASEVVARTIMDTVGVARQQLADRSQEIIADTVGTGSAAARAIAERVGEQLRGASRYKRSVADVTRWPDSPDARAALEEWLGVAPSDTAAYLAGDFLDFRGADLSNLDLAGAYLANSCLVGVRCEDANLGDANLNNAELDGADFSFSDLAKADLVGSTARNARFSSARLFSVQFDEAVLEGADLSHATLNSAKLYRTDLRAAELGFSSLRWCTLGGANMPAVLSGARMFGCRLEGAKGTVVGPVFVDQAATRSLDGAELEAWFSAQDAPDVRVAPRTP